MNISLNSLIEAASQLIGDAPGDNPEYVAGIVQLLGDVIPGEAYISRSYIAGLLELEGEF